MMPLDVFRLRFTTQNDRIIRLTVCKRIVNIISFEHCQRYDPAVFIVKTHMKRKGGHHNVDILMFSRIITHRASKEESGRGREGEGQEKSWGEEGQ